jgi:hypothetical protein
VGDESGSFAAGDWMVVGLVLLSDPLARRAEMAAIRAKYGYTAELKFNSRDKNRLPVAMAVLSWFYATRDLEFRCIAKCGDEFDLAYYNHAWRGLSPEVLAYNYTYREVLQAAIPAEPRRVSVKVDEKSRHREDNLLEYLRQDLPSVRLVVEADSQSDDLLQLADLLVGCVRADLVGTTEAIKRSMADAFLWGAGRASALDRPTKCAVRKANIWRWVPPPRTEKRVADRS